jgi:hypothetical protein
MSGTASLTNSASPAACRQGTFSQFKKVSPSGGTGFTTFSEIGDPVTIKALTVNTTRSKTENTVEVTPELSNASSHTVSAYRLGWIAAWNDATGQAQSTAHAEELMPMPARLAIGKTQVGLRHEIPVFLHSPRPEYVVFFVSEVRFSDGETWTANTEKVRTEATK